MYKVIAVSVLLGVFLAACSSYTTPPEDFLSARIQFETDDLTKKNISVSGFVNSLRSFKSGDQETRILGWVRGERHWTLVSEIAGEKYECIFTDILTDKSGHSIAVLQSIYRADKNQDTKTLLNLIIK